MAINAVYRFYNNADLLLYVGCSYDPFSRFGKHITTRGETMRDVCRVTVIWYDSLDDASDAEIEAIILEGPVWNKINNPNHSKLAKRRLEKRMRWVEVNRVAKADFIKDRSKDRSNV